MDRKIKQREILGLSKRIVIKFGSRILINEDGQPEIKRIKSFVNNISKLHQNGLDIVVVSSGAIAVGMQSLNYKERPKNLPQLQMAASVGQVRLMALYDNMFSKLGCSIGQVLLTHDDLKNRSRHLNARNTIQELLRQNLIPIVNENDVVSVDEIKFGDNDILAALVSILIDANTLVLLTTSDGLQSGFGTKDAERIPFVDSVSADTFALAGKKQDPLSLGGMQSKLKAAQTAATTGANIVIADGRKENIIRHIFTGKDTGTLIATQDKNNSLINGRKRWIAFFHKASGSLIIDQGAEVALTKNGNSLLPIGIKKIEGHFSKGSLVNIKTLGGKKIARGLVDYSSERLQKIKGKKTSEIHGILGYKDYDEAVHRDNMVLLTK